MKITFLGDDYMSKMQDAVERIKRLECPTGEVENRVAGILEEYGVASKNEVNVKRYEGLDINGAEGFCAELPSSNQSIMILANSGMDDYVAKVVDAYIK